MRPKGCWSAVDLAFPVSRRRACALFPSFSLNLFRLHSSHAKGHAHSPIQEHDRRDPSSR